MQDHRLPPARLFARLPPHGDPGTSRYAPPAAELPVDAPSLDDDVRDAFTSAARTSATGSILFVHGTGVYLVIPPFPVERECVAASVDTEPLRELLARQRSFAALLLRRGGYTVGFFRGDFLVASKTDRRFVKNRHRAGGQSQRRFDRIREKQLHELFEKLCADARATLAPYEREVEALYLGGDRQALIAFRKQCPWLDRTFGTRVSGRRLAIPGEPRRASLDAVPADVYTSALLEARQLPEV